MPDHLYYPHVKAITSDNTWMKMFILHHNGIGSISIHPKGDSRDQSGGCGYFADVIDEKTARSILISSMTGGLLKQKKSIAIWQWQPGNAVLL
jgi:hypothetical protein